MARRLGVTINHKTTTANTSVRPSLQPAATSSLVHHKPTRHGPEDYELHRSESSSGARGRISFRSFPPYYNSSPTSTTSFSARTRTFETVMHALHSVSLGRSAYIWRVPATIPAARRVCELCNCTATSPRTEPGISAGKWHGERVA